MGFLLLPAPGNVFAADEPTLTPIPTPTQTEVPEKIFTPDPVLQGNYVRVADGMLHELAAIRGLKVKRDVPLLFKDREFFRGYFRRKLKEQMPPEKLKVLLKAYRALGLYDGGEGDPYEEELKDLVAGIRGLYDPEQKAVYIAEWTDPSDWDENVAHELVHALQDQYFDLKKRLDSLEGLSYDERHARSCVIEGEATALAKEYVLKVEGSGKTLAQSESVRRQNDINMLIGLGRAWFRGQRGRVRLEDTMGFVYAYGATFFQEILKVKDWPYLDEVHRRPPRSTCEIIHPDLYLGKRRRGTVIRIRGLTEPEKPLAGYHKLWEDTFGEYGLSMILGSRIHYKYARSATEGWRGDTLQVYEDKTGKERVLVGYVLFGDEWQADRFFGSYEEFLKKKIKPEETLIWGDGRYRAVDPKTKKLCHLELRGRRVFFIENLDRARLEPLLAEIMPKSVKASE